MAWDESLYPAALLSLYIMCPLTVLTLQFLAAPYGWHASAGWGSSLPPPLAWFLMGSPTLWFTLPLLLLGGHRSHALALLVLSLYLLHYVHRTLLYPLCLIRLKCTAPTKKPSRGFPLLIALIAFAFNLLIVYLQARSASHCAHYPEAIGGSDCAGDPVLLLGGCGST